MGSDPGGRSSVDDLLAQLGEFRATGDELTALRVLAALADLPRAEWPALVERAASEGATHTLSVLADLAAGVASGASALPDADGWHAVWVGLR